MVCALIRRSCARCDKNRSIHSRASESMIPWSSAHQRVGHELTDAGQKYRAHGRVEAFRVAGADGQYSQLALGSQGSEGHRADLDRVLAEQIITLRIADLSATRLSGLQQRFESLEVGVGRIAGAQEPAGR